MKLGDQDWQALAFLAALLTVQCGSVLAIATFYKNRDQQNRGSGLGL